MASKAIEDLVILLGETFRQGVSRATIEAYAVGLEGMSTEQVLTAGKRAIQSCKFMPTPAELRDLAGVGNASRGVMAWGDVQRAMSHGRYRHVDFSDPLINASIRLLGGWPGMFDRLINAEGEKWYRLEFIKTYEGLITSGVDGDACRPLTGLSESEVCSGQIGPPRPRRIACDETRCGLSLSVVRGPVGSIESSRPTVIPKVEFRKP